MKTIPLRLRQSNLEVLHTCERKWQIENLLAGSSRREESEHLSFGSAYGVGIATYLVTQDTDRALYEAWLAYWPEVETEKKNIPLCMRALMAAFVSLDTLLLEYEVATFNGKPAVELGFKLNISEEYYFTGHLDVVLRSRYSGVHYVMDAKTTGLPLYDLSPLYQNSGQCLGYSIALDKIVGEKQSSYGVIYLVGQIGKSFQVKTHTYVFEKTLMDRLNWFITLGMDVNRLKLMAELNVYPKRGGSCLKYNKPCPHFGTCHLSALDSPLAREPDPLVYDFEYDLQELIDDHVIRVASAKHEPVQQPTIVELDI